MNILCKVLIFLIVIDAMIVYGSNQEKLNNKDPSDIIVTSGDKKWSTRPSKNDTYDNETDTVIMNEDPSDKEINDSKNDLSNNENCVFYVMQFNYERNKNPYWIDIKNVNTSQNNEKFNGRFNMINKNMMFKHKYCSYKNNTITIDGMSDITVINPLLFEAIKNTNNQQDSLFTLILQKVFFIKKLDQINLKALIVALFDIKFSQSKNQQQDDKALNFIAGMPGQLNNCYILVVQDNFSHTTKMLFYPRTTDLDVINLQFIQNNQKHDDQQNIINPEVQIIQNPTRKFIGNNNIGANIFSTIAANSMLIENYNCHKNLLNIAKISKENSIDTVLYCGGKYHRFDDNKFTLVNQLNQPDHRMAMKLKKIFPNENFMFLSTQFGQINSLINQENSLEDIITNRKINQLSIIDILSQALSISKENFCQDKELFNVPNAPFLQDILTYCFVNRVNKHSLKNKSDITGNSIKCYAIGNLIKIKLTRFQKFWNCLCCLCPGMKYSKNPRILDYNNIIHNDPNQPLQGILQKQNISAKNENPLKISMQDLNLRDDNDFNQLTEPLINQHKNTKKGIRFQDNQ